MSLTKRTPCVGICSTTYGDLVCRGCKRFAHEIVQWNGYQDSQQDLIWARLHRLRDEVVAHHVMVQDSDCYTQTTQSLAGTVSLAGAEQLYEMVRFLAVKGQPLEQAGLVGRDGQIDAMAALQAIDGEIYERSCAHYERNFKVPV